MIKSLHLNWKEIQELINHINPKIENLFVERVIIPERSYFPEGYLKGEWALRLTGKKQEGTLLMSVRPQHPYFFWYSQKFRSSASATRSSFDLMLAKYLKNTRLLYAEAIFQERIVVFWFSQGATQLGLVLVLIPAAPEAFLVETNNPQNPPWSILARTRTIRNPEQALKTYSFPTKLHTPADPSIRSDLLQQLHELEVRNQEEAFEIRVLRLKRLLEQQLKQTLKRISFSKKNLQLALQEPDWQTWGDCLKASFDDPNATIPSLPLAWQNLSRKDQAQKCYRNEKRKKRKREESQERLMTLQTKAEACQEKLLNLPSDAQDLQQQEKLAGILKHLPPSQIPSWPGKSFTSEDGFLILVGKNQKENLELTFKHARGNDLWLHVRGRPGSHVIIPLPPKKSAPLNTLLDAAMLAIHYSGGQNWGKTEVDYTYKKYVKRIKKTNEVSYSANKTLCVEPDTKRIQRLLAKQ